MARQTAPGEDERGSRTTWELTQTVATARGRIAYDVLGSGDPVVLVHGTPSRSYVWRHVAPVLARDHTVFVWDLLGFGDSERHVEQDVGLVAHGEVLAELVALWGLDRPAFVGHDIGGAICLRAHLVEGIGVSRIALMDAVALAPWITPRTREMQRDHARWGALPSASLEAVIREHLETATAGPLAPDVFAALFGQWEGERGQALYLRNLDQLDEGDTAEVERRLAGVDVPVLVLWGGEDAWLPLETSERLAARIPNASRTVVPGAGHFCMEDAPEAVAAALSEFLAGSGGAQGASRTPAQ
jgi:pimeloyl-ACP methyl ester carboxylesterase